MAFKAGRVNDPETIPELRALNARKRLEKAKEGGRWQQATRAGTDKFCLIARPERTEYIEHYCPPVWSERAFAFAKGCVIFRDKAKALFSQLETMEFGTFMFESCMSQYAAALSRQDYAEKKIVWYADMIEQERSAKILPAQEELSLKAAHALYHIPQRQAPQPEWKTFDLFRNLVLPWVPSPIATGAEYTTVALQDKEEMEAIEASKQAPFRKKVFHLYKSVRIVTPVFTLLLPVRVDSKRKRKDLL